MGERILGRGDVYKRQDGTVGMVIPAMDSCRACIMGDGWYEQNNSISMSIYDMIEKGLFQVQ